jgi:peptidoglycan-associated lipoprotein
VAPHRDAQNPLASERAIYFGSGSWGIRATYDPMLQRHGAYLAAHPELKLRVEAHTDPRGAKAANRMLAKRRGMAVISALKKQGATAAQLELVIKDEVESTATDAETLGKERRVQLVYSDE